MSNHTPSWSLRRAERAGAAHALGAKLAHDLGTPLNVILGRASLLADDPDASDEQRAHAEVIAKQARALHGLISGFIGTVRAPYEGIAPGHADLAPIAEAAAHEVESVEDGVEIVVDTTPGGAARLDPLLATHAVSAALAHAASLAVGPVRLSVDVAQVDRPQARRCAPGPYGRFVIEVDLRDGAAADGDPDLALAACEGSLRLLGGYLGSESADGKLRLEACLPAR